ncbi:MAG: RNase adapter RapZ [Acidobacteriota bacterium]
MNGLIIITGLSGSGKSLAARAFEDMGYFCVDNLPVQLIPTFSELITKAGAEFKRASLVIDIRERKFLNDFPRIITDLRKTGKEIEIIFFEASQEILKRRFNETRRPHPLAQEANLEYGIQKEIEIMRPIRDFADRVIDTSKFNIHELRLFLKNSFRHEHDSRINISIISFGYKYGIPSESDLVFDVRFLSNPYFEEELKSKTGLESDVISYLKSFKEYFEFIKILGEMMTFLIPRYIQEGKSYLTISIGCTGGKHRSVALAEELKSLLAERDCTTSVFHRDIDKE